jgi:hypothetical protein
VFGEEIGGEGAFGVLLDEKGDCVGGEGDFGGDWSIGVDVLSGGEDIGGGFGGLEGAVEDDSHEL